MTTVLELREARARLSMARESAMRICARPWHRTRAEVLAAQAELARHGLKALRAYRGEAQEREA
jgi:hypothetical protein